MNNFKAMFETQAENHDQDFGKANYTMTPEQHQASINREIRLSVLGPEGTIKYRYDETSGRTLVDGTVKGHVVHIESPNTNMASGFTGTVDGLELTQEDAKRMYFRFETVSDQEAATTEREAKTSLEKIAKQSELEDKQKNYEQVIKDVLGDQA